MASKQRITLGDLIFGLAESAVAVQSHFNEACLSQVNEFEAILDDAPIMIQNAMKPLINIRYQVREFEFTVKSLITVSTEKGFEIRACPINIGCHLRQGSKSTLENTITFSVEQVPVSLECTLLGKSLNKGGTKNGS